MDKKLALLTCLGLCTVGLPMYGLADDSHKTIYCPDVTELSLSMCQTKGDYNEDPLPFPRCLILFKGKPFTFSNGLTWRLVGVTPSLSETTRLQFQTAYINQQGVFCAYRAKTQDLYVALELISKVMVMPTIVGWKVNDNGSEQPYQANTFNPKINYSCVPDSHKVIDCPFSTGEKTIAIPRPS